MPFDTTAQTLTPFPVVRESQGYFAHSSGDSDRSRWQSLAEHSHNVGTLAADKARPFGGQEAARAQGKLHDLGKYTAAFQRRLEGDPRSVDHSTWGAITAVQRYGDFGHLLAYGIAGHHAGLANGRGEGERTPLADRLKGTGLDPLDPTWEQELTLPEKSFPEGFKLHPQHKQFQRAFLTRMLFSCLVDADFIDTENYYLQLKREASGRESDYPSLTALREQLDVHLRSFSTEGGVNPIRSRILSHVRGLAAATPGLFSLTVPTGGGKTLASLAFALDHAIRHGLRRVIFVIPFTSIVEQNAAVFRRALGKLGEAAVLEHHSAFVEAPPPRSDLEKYQATQKLRLAMENWDAPIIVTTAVQFFESLFAARPSQCRKLHNIAGSVVILDEAQTMPLKVLRPCVAAIDELACNYRTSVVLCTATQPALQTPRFKGGLDHVRELAPDPPHLYRELERVRVRHIGVVDDDALAQHMRSRDQVLCIVNNRQHARAVYEAMHDLPGARHLTTLMCAKHRSEVLDDIRYLLKNQLPCRVVSTSLIEAGVDVDFPTVMRAEAGLDSIAQAAGRCNREGGRNRDASEVIVFQTVNKDWAPPPEIKQFAEAAREVLRRHADEPLAPAAIQQYFELLYWQQGDEQLDKHGLMPLLKASRIDSLPMETLATKFRMIDDTQMALIIPFDDTARKALNELRFADGCVGLARKLQPYSVQIPKAVLTLLRQAGAVQPVEPEKWGEQFLALVNTDIYTNSTGLTWANPSFISASRLNW
ncbi:MAG: CRISPR-associated endonuclease Cas3'' [Ramlibacter sp.]|nr:CRISPR-associated endonuclease Cas3'' [Ramlibacter sp.]